MSWTVLLHEDFIEEMESMPDDLQDELLAHARLLSLCGPDLGRPTVDTLKGSRHPNMKELRFGWKRQVWRVAFAFDPRRQAVLLVAGNKGGADQRRFYRRLITAADARFDEHLAGLEPATKGATRGKKS